MCEWRNEQAAAAIYLLSILVPGAEASFQCIICMDFVNSIAIFRRLSPLHYFLRWGISCGAKGRKRFHITTLLSARIVSSQKCTHTHKSQSEIERVTLLMTFIIMPSVCRRGIFAARQKKNTSPANSDDTKCYFL